ncbi:MULTISPECIES: AzlD domain-containing protein [Rhodomicrobium]|uniref:AzlD family protein n=1 Tax=Rhodomicrobium TaxID=1068 RepID=UPI000B4BE661|nr:MULTISPECIES: AzlD domain-containing protein [Rhodomicrobium]
MTIRGDVLLAILLMALVSFVCRAGGYAILRKFRPPVFAEAMLRHLPGALFAAYVTPSLVAGGVPALIGALAVASMQIATRNLGLAIVAGVAAVWAAQAALG